MSTFEKDVQYHLNKIMEAFEMEDEIYGPKIRLTYLVRDLDQKRSIHYEYSSDIFQARITAEKYRDTISKNL